MRLTTLTAYVGCFLLLPLTFGVTQAAFRVVGGEYKSYRQIGDRKEVEYERLNSDGTISRSVAQGDARHGLRLQNFEIDPLGNLLNVDSYDSRGRIQNQHGGNRAVYGDAEFIPKWEEPKRQKVEEPEPPKQTPSHFWDVLKSFFN